MTFRYCVLYTGHHCKCPIYINSLKYNGPAILRKCSCLRVAAHSVVRLVSRSYPSPQQSGRIQPPPSPLPLCTGHKKVVVTTTERGGTRTCSSLCEQSEPHKYLYPPGISPWSVRAEPAGRSAQPMNTLLRHRRSGNVQMEALTEYVCFGRQTKMFEGETP